MVVAGPVDWHEKHLPGRKLTNQEKTLIVVLFFFLLIVVGGIIAVIVVETENRTMCGGAITNTPNASKPKHPA